MIEDIPITCPLCDQNSWRLAKYEYSDGTLGLRVTCTKCGIVDNVTSEISEVSTVWKLIELETK